MLRVGLEPSEVMVSVPFTLPLVWGAKLTVKLVDWEALRVSGVVIPLTWNPATLTDICEMSTVDPPVLVSVTVCDCSAPTDTLPKTSLAGLSASCPGALVVPVPESATFITVSEASLVIAAVALKTPAASGVNLTLIEVFCPAATVTGRLGEIREKYLVEIAIPLIVTDADPEFDIVIGRVLLLPAGMLPKPRSEFADRVLICCWMEVPPVLKPWQPTRKAMPAIRSNVLAALPRHSTQFSLSAAFRIGREPQPEIP